LKKRKLQKKAFPNAAEKGRIEKKKGVTNLRPIISFEKGKEKERLKRGKDIVKVGFTKTHTITWGEREAE